MRWSCDGGRRCDQRVRPVTERHVRVLLPRMIRPNRLVSVTGYVAGTCWVALVFGVRRQAAYARTRREFAREPIFQLVSFNFKKKTR